MIIYPFYATFAFGFVAYELGTAIPYWPPIVGMFCYGFNSGAFEEAVIKAEVGFELSYDFVPLGVIAEGSML